MAQTKSPIWKRVAIAFSAIAGVLVAALAVFWIWAMPGKHLRGLWQTEGYGYVIEIGPFVSRLIDHTKAGCVENMAFPSNLFLLEWAEGVSMDVEGGKLILDTGGIHPWTANRINQKPAGCDIQKDPNDPVWNFEVFWANFDEHYPFFDMYGVDWDARRTEGLNTLAEGADLINVLKKSLRGINDGHVGMIFPDGWFSPKDISNQPGSREAFRSAFIDFDSLTSEPNTGLMYKKIKDDTALIYMAHMGLDVPGGRRSDEFAYAAMGNVLNALGDVQNIIIDVRFNPGGSDEVSMSYARYFTHQRRMIFSKVTQLENDFSEPFEAFVEPAEQLSDAKVVFLTGQHTGSAAEIMTFAMRGLPNVTVLGGATAGALSDSLGRKLPNGIDFGLSHQIYRAPDGAEYEGHGIPPDIDMPLTKEMLYSASDEHMKAALKLLSQ